MSHIVRHWFRLYLSEYKLATTDLRIHCGDVNTSQRTCVFVFGRPFLPPSSMALLLWATMTEHDEFYLRYYVGHRGQFGHEFMEFELYPSGKLRYANHSRYKDDSLIRKQVFVSPAVVEEFKRMIRSSDITRVDDSKWKEPDPAQGSQELECKIGSHHLAFTTCEIGSTLDIQQSPDPEGLKVFYLLVQDLKALVMSLISCHFNTRPIPGP